MKVDRVTATIRYSRDSGKGAWKSVEVGAEATLASNEDWHTAQHQLYHQLAQQMKALWANGKPPQEPPRANLPAPQREHWCAAHRTEYRKFSKDGRTWYSHKASDGQWCKKT